MKKRNPSSALWALVCLLLLKTSFIRAQNPQAEIIKWKSSQAIDLKSNQVIDGDFRFTTGPSSVKWDQKSGTKVYVFDVTKITGTLQNVTDDGEVTYEVSLNQKKGSITIQRINGTTKLRLIYRDGDGNGLDREYKIAMLNE